MRQAGGIKRRIQFPQLRFSRPLRRRDFRLLWLGAFLSFVGSWIQIVAQGDHVHDLTHSAAKLGLVSFCGSAPVFLIGPFAGAITDKYHKRAVMVITQILFGLGALFLAAADYFGFIQYWHFIAVALLFGFVGAVEMPTRQSVVSRVVPMDELPEAIPINAMTFNLARVGGPAIGGILLAKLGHMVCYFINGISYLALVFAALAIRADLAPAPHEPQPMKDLLVEGMRYTFRDIRLRTLFILESSTSMFALIYMALMPAIVKDILGLGEVQLGLAYTFVGLGAISGLIVLLRMSALPHKATIIKVSMLVMGISLFLLGSTKSVPVAYTLFAFLGMASIAQFNVTNTLFQLLSPDRLRGRVLAMHLWALSGLGPFGTLAGGYLAQNLGIPFTLKVFAGCLLAFTAWGWLFKRGLAGVD